MAEPIEMPFGLRTRVGPGTTYYMGVQIPHGKWQFFGWETGIPSHSMVICAKTVEPIEMPFGWWARMGRRNRVLDGDPEVLGDVAMATNFWLSLDYNFGCIIARDTLFDSRSGFLGSSYPMKTQPISWF